jgi:hypothetical protein
VSAATAAVSTQLAVTGAVRSQAAAKSADLFTARAAGAGEPLEGATGIASGDLIAGSGHDSVESLLASLQPALHGATGFHAHFGVQERRAAGEIAGGQRFELPTGNGRGPSYHAEAGKPLTVTTDAGRFREDVEKVELIWRIYPGGEDVVVPMSTGERDPQTGRLVISPATIAIPEDAAGVVRLSLQTTSKDGRVSDSWDPSNDAAIAPKGGATIVFTDGWETRVSGALQPGERLQLAYDVDRLREVLGRDPAGASAFVSFNGGEAVELPLRSDAGAVFLPSLKIPIDATEMSVWFRGTDQADAVWDSALGQNYDFELGVARDDAESGWKSQTLKSPSFPNLTEDNFVGIGPSTQRYNCIAWTLGIRDEWVWPGTRMEDFDRLYGEHGYTPLDTLDFAPREGFEKVVIYGLPPKGTRREIEVTHGARIHADGQLTSKLGTNPLIRHQTADGVSGPSYGEPVRVYERPIATAQELAA